MLASGVRSSCATSATSCWRSCWAVARLAAMALKLFARSTVSALPPTGTRCDRSPWPMRWAAAVEAPRRPPPPAGETAPERAAIGIGDDRPFGVGHDDVLAEELRVAGDAV